jgi:hypothetical protein
MRNSIRIALALALTLAFASWSAPASADVFVFAEIFKDKEIFFTVEVVKDKDIEIYVTYEEELDGAAEAEAIVNQFNEVNDVDDAVNGELTNFDLELDAFITLSVNDNTGIVGVNQDVGAMVNQANVVSLATTNSESAFTDSEALAEQSNVENFVRQHEVLEGTSPDFDPDHDALIQDSVNGNFGIVGVNQNAGSNNNQANVVAAAIGLNAHVALSEAALGQYNADNEIEGIQTVKVDLITNSVNNNSGIVGVNQTTGNNNNQAAVVAFSALTSTAAISVPGL